MGMFLRLALLIFLSTSAQAQDVTLQGVSNYFCKQLGGSSSGNSCTAPYKSYSGDACSIFEASDANSQVKQFVEDTKNSCSSSGAIA